MSSQSQECYYQNISPGKNIESPGIVKNKLENKLSENFTVITININKIDWLYLSSAGHTRVKFLKNDGFTGQWIAKAGSLYLKPSESDVKKSFM